MSDHIAADKAFREAYPNSPVGEMHHELSVWRKAWQAREAQTAKQLVDARIELVKEIGVCATVSDYPVFIKWLGRWEVDLTAQRAALDAKEKL